MRYPSRTSLLFVCAFLTTLVGSGLYFRYAANAHRAAIAAFSATITLGMPRSEAIRLCDNAIAAHQGWEHRLAVMTLDGLSADVVESPLTFGASNWVVYIVFEGDVVVAVLVRTEDTKRFRPKSAPQDRVDDPNRPPLAEFFERH